jgi:beta-lactamase class A
MATVPSARRRATLPILEMAGGAMILAATVLLVTQLSGFSAERQRMPYGLVMAGVPVSGQTREETQATIERIYGAPITVMYRDQEIRLNPDQVGFRINSEAMLSRADELRTEGTFWSGFWDFIWRRPEQAFSVELVAEYSPDLLRAWLADVAARYDRPPQPARPVLETLSFESGQPGYTMDQEASFTLIDAALCRPVNRTVNLVINEIEAPHPSLETLKALLVDYLLSTEFAGVASIHVTDLQTGEEMELNVDLRQGTANYLNCDVAYASTSTMKIPIMIDFFRFLDWMPEPGSDEYKILMETMLQSGNISANFMMQDIGYGDTQRGVDDVRNMTQYLGLPNTFIIVPYDDNKPPVYYSTPAQEAARAGQCVDTRPDYAMQTTVSDLATLLDMIYQCAEYNGGGLIAAYPNQITQAECQMMLDIMKQNPDGILMAGLPADIEIAHKHGWAYDTHGDAGIIFSPRGDYVLVAFLWADTDWLNAQISFPIIQNISSATFNFFNPDMVLVPRRGFATELGINP